MKTHGLLQTHAAADGSPSLPHDRPALRISLRTGEIVEVSPAFGRLTGHPPAAWIGRRCEELWPSAERDAIGRRISEAVLVGRDHFGSVVLAPAGTTVAWVDLEVCHDPRNGHFVHLFLQPLDRPGAGLIGLPPTGRSAASMVETGPMMPLPAPTVDLLAPAEPRREGPFVDAAPAEAHPATDSDRSAASGGPEVASAAPPAIADAAPAGRGGSAAPAGPASRGNATIETEEEDVAFQAMTVLAAAGVAALTVAVDGTVTSATPEAERLLGRPIARLRGSPLDELVALPDQAGPALAAARAGRVRQSVAASLVGVDGRDLALEWVPGSEPGKGFVMLQSGQAGSADGERLRLQTRLVSFVAHDVRNSLAAVYCGLHTLSEATAPESPQRPIVDKALHEARRASRIVDDVLAVSRPGRLLRVELDLCGVLRESLNRFRARAAAQGAEIHEQLDVSATVMADLSQLERSFDNLVENALHAMPHYGTLAVATRLEDRAVPGIRVAISDTGVGIRPDLRPNVFEPFVTDKQGGTGLGLAITRRVILDHEGQIDFETELGRGTTFHVWLPRLP